MPLTETARSSSLQTVFPDESTDYQVDGDVATYFKASNICSETCTTCNVIDSTGDDKAVLKYAARDAPCVISNILGNGVLCSHM